MFKKRRESIKRLRLRTEKEIKKIKDLIYQVGLIQGEMNAQKVFQVLKIWQEEGLILSYGENPRWSYRDYILHEDGWFINLDGERVGFQIKSSFKSAQKHLKKYPNVPVIVVGPGVTVEELNQQMQELFKNKLSEFLTKGNEILSQ